MVNMILTTFSNQLLVLEPQVFTGLCHFFVFHGIFLCAIKLCSHPSNYFKASFKTNYLAMIDNTI